MVSAVELFEAEARRARVKGSARILTLDIETRPMLVYSWGLFKQFHQIEHIVDDGGILCVGLKWLGEPAVVVDNRDGDEPMLRAVWEALTEADVVVTYNGDRFDIPRLHNEFLKRGWGPPAPYKSIDLIKTNRRRFDLPSRKLDYLAQRTGTGKKVTHEGFGLWVACIEGDSAAWDRMIRYCKGDVTLTERLYLKLLPWLSNAPHIGVLGAAGEWACPFCGSGKIKRHGKRVTAFVRQYSMYRCEDCGGWLRDQFLQGQPSRTRPVK